MIPSRVTFIVEGRCLGEAPVPLTGRLVPHESVVYLCPICGDAWARIIVPGQRFWAQHISCRKHCHHAQELPGSLWLSWDAELCACFPLPVMEREFALAAAQYETA